MLYVSFFDNGIIRLSYGWNAYSRQRSSGMLVGLIDNKPLDVNCYCKSNISGFDDNNVNCYECCDEEILNGAFQYGICKTDSLLEIKLQDIPNTVSHLGLSLHRISSAKTSDRLRAKIQLTYVKILDDNGQEISELVKMNVPSGCKEIILGYIRRNGENWFLADEV